MLSSATHDTKRGEDTRARLLALSELPELWGQTSQRWAERASRYRPGTLDSATEYFFYQTVVGSYPLSVERALAYMLKAARERKVETGWIQPNAEYEAALEQFVRSVYADEELQADVAQFVARLAPAGYLTSLSRTLIKLTAPGIPDLYQGSELWDFSLVDPDNRTPVDFALRRELLASLPKATPDSVLADMARGTPKLWLTWKTLGLRKLRPELFEGRYKRLPVEGPDAEHVVAFTRGGTLVTVVPRLNAHTEPKQRSASVRLPVGRFRNVLTDAVHEREIVATSQLWARFPVTLLVRDA
jgi:(1->4)-alpha-D-glucan 1-alpha-D-glucosylmutase